MTASPNPIPESRTAELQTTSATRPMYWSVQRELWENRSIYIAPLVAGALVLFGFLIHTTHLAHDMRAFASLDAAHQRARVVTPYNMAAFLMVVTTFIVGFFYSLDALHGERRDRSILFWKSLPVSDVTAVLSKAAIPLAVLPLLTFAICITIQLIMLLLSVAVLELTGVGTQTLFTNFKFGESSFSLLYAVIAIALWHAPVYAWLLLVSGWARRTAFLWAVLPLLAVCAFEKGAFNTAHFASFLQYRVVGWFTQAFVFPPPGTVPIHPLSQLTPGRFLTTPGLWIGLIFAAAFLTAAARLRRYRAPI